VADGWFSPGTLFSSNNKTDNYITEKIVESGVKHHNPNPTCNIKVVCRGYRVIFPAYCSVFM
jgi:hypothetical protein